MTNGQRPTSSIDDSTTTYVLDQHRHFDDLRQVAAELAGLLILAAAGAKSAVPDHPMLKTAMSTFREAADGVRRSRPTPRAEQHHACLVSAADALERALEAARRQMGRAGCDQDMDQVLVPLRVGYGYLQRAATLLPGFELVAFGMGCCSGPRPAA